MPADNTVTTNGEGTNSMNKEVEDLMKPFEFSDNSGEVPPGGEGETVPISEAEQQATRAENLAKAAETAKAPEGEKAKTEVKAAADKKEGEDKTATKGKLSGKELLDNINNLTESGKVTTAKAPEKSKEQTTEEPKGAPPARDVSMFGEQEQVWLKRMPYEAYEYFKKELLEKRESTTKTTEQLKKYEEEVKQLKTGKVAIPESYYDNPDSVILTPEFNEAQTRYQTTQNIESHWAQQLELIEKGENWTDLVADKDGNIVLGKSYEPGVNAKIAVQKQLQKAISQTQKYQEELEGYVKNFKTRSEEHRGKLISYEKQLFPLFEDKENGAEAIKYLETEIVPNLEKAGVRRDNPIFTAYAKSLAMNYLFRDQLIALQNNTLEEEKKKEAEKKALEEKAKRGPNGSDLAGASADTGKPSAKAKPSFSQMDSLIRGV